LKVNPAQARHLHIGDQASGIIQAVRLQKFFGRRKGYGLIAKRPEEPLGGFTYRFVVIDDRDQGITPHS
jgi:hypothetical protein